MFRLKDICAAGFLAVIFFEVQTPAQSAEDVSWGQVTLTGTLNACETHQVQTLFSGNSASFLYTGLGLSLLSGQGGMQPQSIAGMLRASVTIPNGMTIRSFNAPLLAGVIKDSGIRAAVVSQISFLKTGSQVAVIARSDGYVVSNQVVFSETRQANLPLFEVVNQANLTRLEKAKICEATKAGNLTLDFANRFEVSVRRMNLFRAMTLDLLATDATLFLEPCSGTSIDFPHRF